MGYNNPLEIDSLERYPASEDLKRSRCVSKPGEDPIVGPESALTSQQIQPMAHTSLGKSCTPLFSTSGAVHRRENAGPVKVSSKVEGLKSIFGDVDS